MGLRRVKQHARYGTKTVYGIIGGFKGCVLDEEWVGGTAEMTFGPVPYDITDLKMRNMYYTHIALYCYI